MLDENVDDLCPLAQGFTLFLPQGEERVGGFPRQLIHQHVGDSPLIMRTTSQPKAVELRRGNIYRL